MKQPTVSKTFTVALVGNPNSGKTTLFNLLTGSDQKVGNWPGVTVERKTGFLRNSSVAIVDTPGVYSLLPYTPEESVTRNYIASASPDLILNVVDSTDPERSLFLTSRLSETGVPMLVALNMSDEARQKGIVLNTKILEKEFHCKFFEISAAKNIGTDALSGYIRQLAAQKEKATPLGHRQNKAFVNAEKSDELCRDIEEKYRKISRVVRLARKTAATPREKQAQNLTRRIDAVVLNRWLALPIFALVMTLVFCLSIGGPGGLLTNLVNNELTPRLQTVLARALADVPQLSSLVTDGIVAGVMSVASFLPQIMLLFGFIAALEASGYMARIAFITDKFLNKVGLGGRSFVSMVLGCGCSVPSIISTRTIRSEDERNATITLAPFVPCSAKLAIISFFTAKIFGNVPFVAVSFYFVSIAAAIIGGWALKLFGKKDNDDAFVLELPDYRAPTLRNITKQMWERGKAFLTKAGTTVFAASIALWVLQNFDFRLQSAEESQSMLASIGKFVAPLFYPLGFNDNGCGWQFAVACLSGIAAKETVFETLQILLPQGVENCISPLGAYVFVIYNILTVPCIAAISASFAEQGRKKGLFSAAFQCATAYLLSMTIYQLGKSVQADPSAIVAPLCIAAIAFGFALSAKHLPPRRACHDCDHCAYRCDKKNKE